MSGIGAIGANNYNASAHYYRSLSSGKKVNTAADNAAALSILQKQLSQSNGLDVGTENLQAGKSALNIAEGTLGNVTDSLQRIRELAVKAAAHAKRQAAKMKEKLSCDGFNLVQNNGEAAGQTVFHFHLHLIPRYRDDGQKILWQPTKPTAKELDDVLKTLK